MTSMENSTQTHAPASTREGNIDVNGKTLTLAAAFPNDHIIEIIRRTGNFYEADVLSKISERLALKGTIVGAAVDAGTYIGNHTLYFSAVLGLKPILCFEANPESFVVLQANLDRNGVSSVTLPVNAALGSTNGFCNIELASPGNRGASKVTSKVLGVKVPVRTLDSEVARLDVREIVLLKIDVEGSELDVLRGAQTAISNNLPLICIEAHTGRSLLGILRMISCHEYTIVDCLGYSPTYIIERLSVPRLTRVIANSLWVVRACLPTSSSRLLWYMKRIAQRATGIQ